VAYLYCTNKISVLIYFAPYEREEKARVFNHIFGLLYHVSCFCKPRFVSSQRESLLPSRFVMSLSMDEITLLVLDLFRLLRLELGRQYSDAECSLEMQTRFFSV
jgi:hypothetical protein